MLCVSTSCEFHKVLRFHTSATS